jgi:hypothetical protein
MEVFAPSDIDARLGALHEPHRRSPSLDPAEGVHLFFVVVKVGALIVLRTILLLLGDELADAESRPGQHGAV